MSCPKISALLSQHWRHSAHCDCLGSCWRAISLNEDCKHAGKKVLTWPCALEGQVYASTSTDSWFQPQWEESWQGVSPMALVLCDATHHGILWQLVEKRGRRCGEGFGRLERGRLHQTCGLLWSSLAGAVQSSTKWSISMSWSPKDTHTPGEVWPAVWKCGLSSSGQNGALWVNDGTQPWGDFPGNHCRLSSTLRPTPSIDTMESQTVPVRSVYLEGRDSGEHNEFQWPRVGQLMILALSGSALMLIIGSAWTIDTELQYPA